MIRRMLTHTAAATLVVAVAAFAFQALAGGEGVARTAGSLTAAVAVAGVDHDAD